MPRGSRERRRLEVRSVSNQVYVLSLLLCRY
jgi:hypothetical protein